MAAKTPAEIAALDAYTDAEMLKLVRWAITELVSAPSGATVSVAGRSYTTQNLAQLRELEQVYTARVSVATRPRVLLGDVRCQ